MSLETDIAKFTSLVQDWASKTSDVFYSDVAQDVTIKVIDTMGEVVDITIPNQKKMSNAFDVWKSAINLKNTNGVLTDDSGADVSVSKFGGLTLAEYDAMYKTFINKESIKLVPNSGGSSQMVGYDVMAVVTQDNRVLAWGWNSNNFLSYGMGANVGSVVELQQDPTKKGVLISKIYVSGQHIGILYEDGDLYLRGVQSLGHFGIGNTAAQLKFVLSAQNVSDYITSANGDQDEQPMAAVILTDGSVMTAGDNGHGELGIGNTTNTYTWTKVYDVASYSNDKAIKCLINGSDTASFHILTEAGKLFISGYNGYGQLGNGTTGNVSTLTQIVPSVGGAKIIDIVANGYYDDKYTGSTFILTDAGKVYATGYNGQGQLGTGDTTNLSSFTEVIYEANHDITTDPVVGIYTYHRTSAYLTQSGNLYAVGQASNGALGDGTTTNNTAYQFILSNVKKFYPTVNADASQYPALYAITNDNKLYSWGNGAYGQLGHYGSADILAPTQVQFDKADLITEVFHCGYSNQGTVYFLTSEGFIYGCGRNNYGQVFPSGTIADEYHASITKINLG